MTMRKYKEIKTGDDIIVVQEMTIEEIEMLAPLLEDMLTMEGNASSEKEMIKFIQNNFAHFRKVLKKCVKPDISEIGLSLVVDMLKAFWEVNKDFFVQLAGVATELKESSKKV